MYLKKRAVTLRISRKLFHAMFCFSLTSTEEILIEESIFEFVNVARIMPDDFFVIETVIDCFIIFQYQIHIMKHETIEFFSFACLIKSNVQKFCSIEQSLFSLLLVQPMSSILKTDISPWISD